MAILPKKLIKNLVVEAWDTPDTEPHTVCRNVVTSEYDTSTKTFGELGTVLSIRNYGSAAYIESTSDNKLLESIHNRHAGASRIVAYVNDADKHPMEITALLAYSNNQPMFRSDNYRSADEMTTTIPSGGLDYPFVNRPDRLYATFVYYNPYPDWETISSDYQISIGLFVSPNPTFEKSDNDKYPRSWNVIGYKDDGEDWIISLTEAVDPNVQNYFPSDPKSFLAGYIIGTKLRANRLAGYEPPQQEDEFPGTTYYTAEEIAACDYTDANGNLLHLYAWGATQPNYVVGAFSEDYSTLTLTKNGDDSNGLMKTIERNGTVHTLFKENCCSIITGHGLTGVMTELSGGTKLVNVRIAPYSFTSISDYCLSNSVAIKEVVVPEGIKTLGRAALQSCTNLTTLYLPSTFVGFADIMAFAFDEKLTDIYYAGSMSTLSPYVNEDTWYNAVMGTNIIHCSDGDLTIDCWYLAT